MMLPPLYPILDTKSLARRNCAVETAARAMIDGGAGILQFRHKGQYSRDVFAQAERVAAMCQEAGVPLVVDDRADIALLVDAGLHVGQDDLPPQDARRLIGPERVLGFSTHNIEQLRAAMEEPVDYLAIGPIFPTASKEKPDAVVGVALLRAMGRSGTCPTVAIGGITRENALAVLAAGADSVAVIGDLLPEVCTYATLFSRIREWQQLLKR
jgi:thiamine-phosphate pyrophosphorylase